MTRIRIRAIGDRSRWRKVELWHWSIEATWPGQSFYTVNLRTSQMRFRRGKPSRLAIMVSFSASDQVGMRYLNEIAKRKCRVRVDLAGGHHFEIPVATLGNVQSDHYWVAATFEGRCK